MMLEKGYLTTEKIRKYPLSLGSLHMLEKLHAMSLYQPFKYDPCSIIHKSSPYYLTDEGLEWAFTFMQSKPLSLLKSLFTGRLTHVTEEDMADLSKAKAFSNFKGLTGVPVRAGSKQKAVLVRRVKRCDREYYFDSLAEARDAVRMLLRKYPIEEFTLYKMHRSVKNGKEYFSRVKVDLVLDLSNRGFAGRRQMND